MLHYALKINGKFFTLYTDSEYGDKYYLTDEIEFDTVICNTEEELISIYKNITFYNRYMNKDGSVFHDDTDYSTYNKKIYEQMGDSMYLLDSGQHGYIKVEGIDIYTLQITPSFYKTLHC